MNGQVSTGGSIISGNVSNGLVTTSNTRYDLAEFPTMPVGHGETLTLEVTVFDPDGNLEVNNPEGNQDKASIHDIFLESAISTICDHEDSVAAVDAEDKVLGYKNWLGLMKGNLNAEFKKKGRKYFQRAA